MDFPECLPELQCCWGCHADRCIPQALPPHKHLLLLLFHGRSWSSHTPPAVAHLPSDLQATESLPPGLCDCVSPGSLGSEECFLWPSSLGSWLSIWSQCSPQGCPRQRVLWQHQALVLGGSFCLIQGHKRAIVVWGVDRCEAAHAWDSTGVGTLLTSVLRGARGPF